MMRSDLRTFLLTSFVASIVIFAGSAFAQGPMPSPGMAKSVSVPAVKTAELKNGLVIAVVERPANPIATVQLIVRSGASSEPMEKAGLADMTASMLTKGTSTRSAEQIAQEMEFLGSSLNSGAGWNNSGLSMTVTSDKLEKALAIMADVVLNPSFKDSELDLLRSQSLDELKYNLTQPGFLGSYVASVYSYGEHPAGGTPQSIAAISNADIQGFYNEKYNPGNSILLFTGNITLTSAEELANKFFANWKNSSNHGTWTAVGRVSGGATGQTASRILVVDLPNSGQASVSYSTRINGIGRGSDAYYTASVLNSILGGGYSSRLNQEIRIKRGLSYGAGSNFSWRPSSVNFIARAQTKTVSSAEVAELLLAEIKRATTGLAEDAEIGPRKLVLTGGFDRSLETTQGLAQALADLYSFGLPTSSLNSYAASVQKVNAEVIRSFAAANIAHGDIIIVGDYSAFKDDLSKRLPGVKVDVVKVSDLDITKANLTK